MLTAILLTALAAGPTQEANARPPVVDPAPAPAVTAPNVRAYLEDAESALYHPDQSGLRSLSFSMHMDNPMGRMGTIQASWSVAEGDSVSFHPAPDSPVPPQMVDALRGQAVTMGNMLLTQQLNRFFSRWLKENVATLEGVEEGLVKVRLMPVEGSDSPTQEQILLFDDEGIIHRARQTMQNMGQSMTSETTFQWRPVTPDSDLLVLATSTSVTDMGMMKVSETLSFDYITVEDLVLVSGMKVEGMGQKMDLPLEDLRVNGELVADAAGSD